MSARVVALPTKLSRPSIPPSPLRSLWLRYCRIDDPVYVIPMPLEIETKLRVDSHEPVRERLRAEGAARLGQVMERNRIFDRPDGSLRAEGCGLRVRSARNEVDGETHATLTFKGPVRPGAMKSREEIEIRIDDAEAAAELLTRLGFVVILDYDKRRESWSLGDCVVELDEPPALGLFVEIEGPDEAGIRRVQQSLGLESAPPERSSYVRMLVERARAGGEPGRFRLA